MLASSLRFVINAFQALIAVLQVKFLRAFWPGKHSAREGPLRRILVVKLDELGDVAMALPLLAALRHRLPETEVTLILNRNVAGLLNHAPGITTLSVDVRCNKIVRPLLLPFRYYRFVKANHLRRDNFDVCLLPRRDADDVYATILAYLVGADRTVSFTEFSTPRKARVNKDFDRLLTDVLPPPPVQHETVSNLGLLRVLGVCDSPEKPEIPLSSEDHLFAAEVVPDLTPCIALCPTAGHSHLKQWGVDKFCEVARRLTADGYSIVLLGAPADSDLASEIEAAGGQTCVNLVGKTTLSQMSAVLSRCLVFIGNDAGPMHVASALGISTIGIFGPSCSHKFGAWGPRHQILVHEVDCSPCRRHERDRCSSCLYTEQLCLRQINADEVLQAISDAAATATRA